MGWCISIQNRKLIMALTKVQELQNQLIEERAQRILDYDAANPDIGMGMFYGVALAEAEEQLNLKYTKETK